MAQPADDAAGRADAAACGPSWWGPASTATVGCAVVLAAGALLLPGTAARACGTAMVALLIAAPLLRVAVLGWGWLRAGDRRFAISAAAVLGVVAAGAIAAVLVGG